MQIITVNLPSIYLDCIQKMVDSGMYPSRSEAIRVALRDFLKQELGMVESLLDINENDGKITVTETKVERPKKIDMRSIKAGWH